MTNDLNPAGVDEAAAAWMEQASNQPTRLVSSIEAAIRAYLASLPQPEGETAELVERLLAAADLLDNADWYVGPLDLTTQMRITAGAITSFSQRLATWQRLAVTAGTNRDAAVDRAEAAEAQLAHAREAAIEECANFAATIRAMKEPK